MGNQRSNASLAATDPLWSPRRSAALIHTVAAMAMLITGCKAWEPAATPENASQDSNAMSGLRQPGPPGELLGLDPRSRQIEHNLGVR